MIDLTEATQLYHQCARPARERAGYEYEAGLRRLKQAAGHPLGANLRLRSRGFMNPN
jgi:hypothetical protein